MTPITITDVRAVSGDGAFLLDDGKTAVLYDTGFAFTGCKIAENIKKVLGSRPLDYILLTHSHYDHVLGTPYIAKDYPEAKVIAGEYAAQIFQRPSAKAVMRELDRKAAAKHAMTDYEDLTDQLKVDATVKDGERFRCGDFYFEAVALPGHTKCSMGFYLREHKLLLGSETLGVYFGNNTYLPFFLVGYQLTLDAFKKVKQLEIEKILLPHYGVVDQEEAQVYLENSETAVRETAQTMLSMLQDGKTNDEILAFFEERDYLDNVKPTYPIDAFHLNTSIMIEQIRKELLMKNK
nr:MBL fold metallo-hydrolase [Oscillospiraceae bacterium]